MDIERRLAQLPLPIKSHLPQIANAISQYSRILVTAPTGVGKSLGLPWILAHQELRVLVSVPTVVGAESLAAQQSKISPHLSVGYAAEGKIRYNRNNVIIYATSGHVRKRFLSLFKPPTNRLNPLFDFDLLRLDEIPIGSIDDHVNYALLQYGTTIGKTLPKLVLSSATIEEGQFMDVPRYNIEVQTYPIQDFYADRNYDLGDKQLLTDILKAIIAFHQSEIEGHFLVFLAGKAEIERIIKELQVIGDGSILLPAYSSLPSTELAKIYQETNSDKRKIILATNMAETSITIPDVGLVIDSMTENRSETSTTGGFRLALHYISEQSAKQRKGRTGRTRPGVVYRMCTGQFYLGLALQRPEEIYRIPIHTTIIELLDAGLDPAQILTKIETQSIQESMTRLQQLNLVEDSAVTEAGHFVTRFPLGIRIGTILWRWKEAGYPLYPGVVLCSLIDSYGPSYFWYPPQKIGMDNKEYETERANHTLKYFRPLAGRSDVGTLLNMWENMTGSTGGVFGPGIAKLIKQWAVSHSINNRKINEAVDIVRRSTKALQNMGLEVEEGPFTPENVTKALRPIAADIYSDLIMTKGQYKTNGCYRHQATKQVYYLDRRQAVNNLAADYPPQIIPLVLAEISRTTTTSRIINIALNLEELKPLIREIDPAPTPKDLALLTAALELIED